MSLGLGNINVNQHKIPAGSPGPPFDPTSADQGITIDPVTGKIVLGNDTGGLLGQFTVDRFIEQNGHSLFFKDTASGTQVSIQTSFFQILNTNTNNESGGTEAALYILDGATNAITQIGSHAVDLTTENIPGSPGQINFNTQGVVGGVAISNNFGEVDDRYLTASINSVQDPTEQGWTLMKSGRILIGPMNPVPVDNNISQLQVLGSIITDDGGLNSPASNFRIGSVRAVPNVPDANNVLEVEIDGVIVNIIIAV